MFSLVLRKCRRSYKCPIWIGLSTRLFRTLLLNSCYPFTADVVEDMQGPLFHITDVVLLGGSKSQEGKCRLSNPRTRAQRSFHRFYHGPLFVEISVFGYVDLLAKKQGNSQHFWSKEMLMARNSSIKTTQYHWDMLGLASRSITDCVQDIQTWQRKTNEDHWTTQNFTGEPPSKREDSMQQA